MSNSIKEMLRAGRTALGFAITYPAPGIIESIGKGWDWAWIDGQHGQLDERTILECVRTAHAAGIASIVRVPSHEPGVIGRVLDMAPTGIMVPMVDTPEQARRVVDAARFPPLGRRSYGGRRMGDLNGRTYYETANDDTLLLAQIETPEGLENAKAIAGAEGVDVLFFGADDMKIRLGIPINTAPYESEKLGKAAEAIAQAAHEAGKAAGAVTANVDALRFAHDLGYQMLAGGSEVGFAREAAAKRLEELTRAIPPE